MGKYMCTWTSNSDFSACPVDIMYINAYINDYYITTIEIITYKHVSICQVHKLLAANEKKKKTQPSQHHTISSPFFMAYGVFTAHTTHTSCKTHTCCIH